MAHMAIGSRPKQEYEKKLVGLVEVITGSRAAKFTLTEEGKTFKDGSTSIKVNFDDLPNGKVPGMKPDTREPKTLRIRMSQDGSEIEAITPAMGHFKAKLVDLGPRENKDADPVPHERTFGEGTPKENTHLEFFAVYEITEGAFKGAQLPAYHMHYKFEEDPEHEGFTRFAGNFDNKKATRLFQLKEWGDAHGLWSLPIEWDDVTILPELLLRATKKNRLVDLTIKDGYIRELLPVEVEQEDDEDENPFGDEVETDESEDDLDEAIEAAMPKKNGKAPVKPAPKAVPAKPGKGAVKKVVQRKSADDDDL